MPGPFSIPPDAQARTSMLCKLHDGSRNTSKTGTRNALDVEEVHVQRSAGAKVTAEEHPAKYCADSVKTNR